MKSSEPIMKTVRMHCITIAIDGTNAADFNATPPAATALAPGKTTTFKATFKPTAPGARIAVSGMGVNAVP